MFGIEFFCPEDKRSKLGQLASDYKYEAGRAKPAQPWPKFTAKKSRRSVRVAAYAERGLESFTRAAPGFQIKFSLTPPTINGWIPIGAVIFSQHKRSLIQAYSSEEDDLALLQKYAGDEFRHDCHHCNTRRIRAYSFVMRNESGDAMLVAPNCAESLCGSLVLLSALEAIHDFIATIESCALAGGHELEETERVLACAFAEIYENGFYSASAQRSTAGALPERLAGPVPDTYAEEIQALREIIEAAPPGQFMDNAKILMESDYAYRRSYAMLASLPLTYIKAMDDNNYMASSKYQGAVGKSVEDLSLKVIRIRQLSNFHSHQRLLSCADTDNNVYVWSTTVHKNLIVGSEFTMSAQVKAHKSYYDVKQTHLCKCKISC